MRALKMYILLLLLLKARTDTELASEKAWLDAEKVWLNHSEGFSPGRLIKKKNENAGETACMVKLDHGGEVIEIDEEQISKVNQMLYQRNFSLRLLLN